MIRRIIQVSLITSLVFWEFGIVTGALVIVFAVSLMELFSPRRTVV